jgi:hypothetical protein
MENTRKIEYQISRYEDDIRALSNKKILLQAKLYRITKRRISGGRCTECGTKIIDCSPRVHMHNNLCAICSSRYK